VGDFFYLIKEYKMSILGNSVADEVGNSMVSLEEVSTWKALSPDQQDYLESWIKPKHLHQHFSLLEALKRNDVPTYDSLSADKAKELVENFSSLVSHLPLKGLQKITTEVATILGTCEWEIDLSGVSTLSEDVLSIFRKGKAEIVH
jgi:hypothetical protein